MRYVVRREFFGGLVYDRKEDTNIIIDDDFWTALVECADDESKRSITNRIARLQLL